MNTESLPISDTLKLHTLWRTLMLAFGRIPDDIMGVPVVSSVEETLLDTNREFIQL